MTSVNAVISITALCTVTGATLGFENMIVAHDDRISSINLRLPDDGISSKQSNENYRCALEKHAWNQTQAAKYLDISRKTLIYRMEKFGLAAPASEPVTE